MNKICTDIKQSQKLIELGIDICTADMIWGYSNMFNMYWTIPVVLNLEEHFSMYKEDVPAWSLTALLGLLPKRGAEEPMIRKLYYASEPKERYVCKYSVTDMTCEYDNPIDACFEIVCRLLENNNI